MNSYQILAQQLAAKIETTAGTEIALTAADVNLRPFQSGFNFTTDFLRFTNDEVADDLSEAPDFVSGAAATIGVGFALKTAGVLGTEPAVGIFLEACGLKKYTVKTITISAPTGGTAKFLAGSAFTATGSKSGIVDVEISAGGPMRFTMLSTGADLVATDVITVVTATGNATATASGAVTTYGVKYAPIGVGQKTMTIQRGIRNTDGTAAKDRLTRLRGAQGTATIDFAALDALRFAGTFSGALSFHGMGDLFNPVDYEVATPPKYINAPIYLNGVLVCPSTIQFNLGNTVELVPDPCIDGGADGYDRARISKRAPTITLDPYSLETSGFDEIAALKSGDVMPFSVSVGTTPNIIELVAYAVQVRGNDYGDRAGLQTNNLTLAVVRNAVRDNDYAIYFR